MFLSAEEIAASRQQAATHALVMTATWVKASQRLHELLATAGRDAFQHGNRHLTQFGHGQFESLSQLPAILWLEGSVRQSRLLDDACAIVGEAQKACIQNADNQIHAIDGVLLSGLRRAARFSPWELAVTLQAWRTALASGEKTLHDINEVASDTVNLAEREVHQMSQSLGGRSSVMRKQQG